MLAPKAAKENMKQPQLFIARYQEAACRMVELFTITNINPFEGTHKLLRLIQPNWQASLTQYACEDQAVL
jgi:hypothetical protein